MANPLKYAGARCKSLGYVADFCEFCATPRPFHIVFAERPGRRQMDLQRCPFCQVWLIIDRRQFLSIEDHNPGDWETLAQRTTPRLIELLPDIESQMDQKRAAEPGSAMRRESLERLVRMLSESIWVEAWLRDVRRIGPFVYGLLGLAAGSFGLAVVFAGFNAKVILAVLAVVGGFALIGSPILLWSSWVYAKRRQAVREQLLPVIHNAFLEYQVSSEEIDDLMKTAVKMKHTIATYFTRDQVDPLRSESFELG